MPYRKSYHATKEDAHADVEARKADGYEGPTATGQDANGWFSAWLEAPKKKAKPEKVVKDAGLGEG